MVEMARPDRPILAVDDRIEFYAFLGEGLVQKAQLHRQTNRSRHGAARVPDLGNRVLDRHASSPFGQGRFFQTGIPKCLSVSVARSDVQEICAKS
jgi:hypothetical protein